MINAEKLNRTIELVCPTCGGTQFSHDGDVSTVETVKCAVCGRETTKDALIEENRENIAAHANEIGKEAAKKVAAELRRSLKQAFNGSKFIKIE